MDDGFFACFVLVIVIGAAYGLGYLFSSSSSAGDCTNFGKTTLVGHIYSCKVDKKP